MSSRPDQRKPGKRAPVRHFIYKTGLCEGTHVMTSEGALPVEYLVAGDRIVTPAGLRTLRHVSARPLRDCPIEVRRGALGPGRPAADMFLAPDQPVRLADWRSHKLYGADSPSVPVSRLQDGEHITWGEHPGEMLVYDLELESEQVIYAEGMEVMSAALPTPTPAANATAKIAAE